MPNYRVQGGPARPAKVSTTVPGQGGPAKPVYVVKPEDGYEVQGGPAMNTYLVTDPNYPVEGGDAIPISYVEPGASPQVEAGPAIPISCVNVDDLLLLMGGKKNGLVSLPFSDNFTRADGSVGGKWKGATWSIASGVVLNTPVPGVEDVSNGNMETGDPPTGWTGGANSTLASVADERTGGAGSKCLSIINNGASYGQAYQTLDTPSGTWILVNGWAKKVTSANAQLLVKNALDTVVVAYAITTSTDWANLIFTTCIPSASCKIVAADGNTSGGEHRFDDVSIKPLPTAQLFATVPTGVSSVTASSVVTVTPGNYHAGIVINLDNSDTPANYVVAYLGTSSVGAMQARLDKCVNGVISNVIKGDVTYGATKYIKIKKDGDNYSLYYGTTDVQVGTTQVIASMNGTLHGLFSTGGAERFDTFLLEATPANP